MAVVFGLGELNSRVFFPSLSWIWRGVLVIPAL